MDVEIVVNIVVVIIIDSLYHIKTAIARRFCCGACVVCVCQCVCVFACRKSDEIGGTKRKTSVVCEDK